MAQLQFEITNQHIKRTDTFEPVAKSQNYLYAKFTFLTDEWTGLVTALFKTESSVYEMLLDENNECLVPWEVLTSEGNIYVSIFAGDLVTTNQSRVHIIESGYTEDAESSEDPTPSIYEQLLAKYDELNEKIANIDGGLFTDWS